MSRDGQPALSFSLTPDFVISDVHNQILSSNLTMICPSCISNHIYTLDSQFHFIVELKL